LIGVRWPARVRVRVKISVRVSVRVRVRVITTRFKTILGQEFIGLLVAMLELKSVRGAVKTYTPILFPLY
jgi:hypothetical protein